MAGRITFRRNSPGFLAILNGHDVQALIVGHAERIAAGIDAVYAPVNGAVVDRFQARDGARIRDKRMLASVTVRDPRAAAWQARDGILTRGAAAQGLEVRARA